MSPHLHGPSGPAILSVGPQQARASHKELPLRSTYFGLARGACSAVTIGSVREGAHFLPKSTEAARVPRKCLAGASPEANLQPLKYDGGLSQLEFTDSTVRTYCYQLIIVTSIDIAQFEFALWWTAALADRTLSEPRLPVSDDETDPQCSYAGSDAVSNHITIVVVLLVRLVSVSPVVDFTPHASGNGQNGDSFITVII